MIRIAPGEVRSDPPVDGLEITDGEWHLDDDRYGEFIEAATGIVVTHGLSASDCYRIANRLEALVDRHKRGDDPESTLVEEYPDVDSLEAFLWVARFFRECHDCHRGSSSSCLSME